MPMRGMRAASVGEGARAVCMREPSSSRSSSNVLASSLLFHGHNRSYGAQHLGRGKLLEAVAGFRTNDQLTKGRCYGMPVIVHRNPPVTGGARTEGLAL